MARNKVKAGEAYVEATMDDSKLRQGMKRTQQFFEQRFPKSTKVAERAVQGFAKASVAALTIATGGVALLVAGLAAVGTAVTGGVVLGLKKLVDASDQLADSASRTGVGTTALQEMQYAAKQTGASVDGMNGALYRMRRRVANATQGTGPAVRALRDLGLSAEALSAMSPDKQMMVIADAMKGVADESLAAQYAFEIFGDGAKALMPLLSQGADGIAKLRQEANDLGLIIDPEDIASANRLSEVMDKLRALWDAILIKVGAAFVPLLEAGANAIEKHFVPAMQMIESILEDIEQSFRAIVNEPQNLLENLRVVMSAFEQIGKGVMKEIVGFFVQELGAAMQAFGEQLGTWRGGNVVSGLGLTLSTSAGKQMAAGRDSRAMGVEMLARAFNYSRPGMAQPSGPAIPIEEQRRALLERNRGIQGALDESRGRFTEASPLNEMAENIKRQTELMMEESLKEPPDIGELAKSMGTFSARGAEILGSTTNPMTRELQTANKHLRKIVRNTGEDEVMKFS